MDGADYRAPRSTRIGVILAVALMHVAAVLGLIRAFAPDVTERAVESVVAVFTVTVSTPEPPPPPPPQASGEPEGAAGAAGKRARPREVAAPEPKIALAPDVAPKAASSGDANTSGARDSGAGTGAAGAGSGTGSGNSGSGQGAGAARRAEKIAGEINSTRDYPAAGRVARNGDYVVIHMTVGADGRARNCRVQRASRDPESDAITCRLAEQRFRFRPALNAAGDPVESTYGWRQRWWDPRAARDAARETVKE